jgi:hypothetical protein
VLWGFDGCRRTGRQLRQSGWQIVCDSSFRANLALKGTCLSPELCDVIHIHGIYFYSSSNVIGIDFVTYCGEMYIS